MIKDSGHVFWLFGLSGAGKSTLATNLTGALRAQNVPVLALDGDVLRAGLCRGLGFSDADRSENLRRAAEVARLGADSGLCVVAAFITPLDRQRRQVRDIVGASRLSFIYLDAPLDVCRTRDLKGLYAGTRDGKVTAMTGVSSAFEPPSGADLILSTGRENAATCAARLFDFARKVLGARQQPAA
jgi:adenylylsulfate kinase